jgi:hypothetical protein
MLVDMHRSSRIHAGHEGITTREKFGDEEEFGRDEYD